MSFLGHSDHGDDLPNVDSTTFDDPASNVADTTTIMDDTPDVAVVAPNSPTLFILVVCVVALCWAVLQFMLIAQTK